MTRPTKYDILVSMKTILNRPAVKLLKDVFDYQQKANLTDWEMGDIFGVDRVTIFRWRTGRTIPHNIKYDDVEIAATHPLLFNILTGADLTPTNKTDNSMWSKIKRLLGRS